MKLSNIFLIFALVTANIAALSKQTLAQTKETKVILDTDIADDVDDAYALALVGALPNLKLLGVTTTYGHTSQRSQVAAKLLTVMGQRSIPVYSGRPGNQQIGRQYEWAKNYKSASIKSTPAAEYLYSTIKRYPGEVTIIAVGALTNIGDLITAHPEVKSMIKGIYIMGGAVLVGYNGKAPAEAEWNIRCDVPAAKKLFESGIHVTMAGLESTAMMKLDDELQKRLFAKGTPTTDALAALTNLWGNKTPTLFDPVAVAAAGGASFWDTEEMHVTVGDDAVTRKTEGPANVTLLTNPKRDGFMNWYVKTLLDAK